MRETYDVVIIGGGHNGLAAAIELANRAHSVMIVEACDRIGGCATTEEVLAGFHHSPHANCLIFSDIMPRHIAPATLGVDVFAPEAQFGIAFADGRPPAILHRTDLLTRTKSSLSVYSARDADTYVALKRRSARFGTLLRKGMYAPPRPAWFEEQGAWLERAYALWRAEGKMGDGTARGIIEALFESPEVRTLFLALALETGVPLSEPGSDLAFLGLSLWAIGRWRVPRGGMQAYSTALAAAVRRAGADVRRGARVERVLIADGRAIGVRTTGGEEIAASRGILAATPLLRLYDHMLDKEDLSPSEAAELQSFRATRAPSIGGSVFCLASAPTYKSARHDPEINRCLKTVVGFAQPEEVIEQAADVAAEKLPRPAGIVRNHTLWDTALAPPGHAVAAFDTAFPALATLNVDLGNAIEASFPEALFETWRAHLSYVPSVVGSSMSLDSERDFERRMLLRQGSAQYRTSLKGLYLAGTGVHPGGGVHGACGLNAAATFLGDLRRA